MVRRVQVPRLFYRFTGVGGWGSEISCLPTPEFDDDSGRFTRTGPHVVSHQRHSNIVLVETILSGTTWPRDAEQVFGFQENSLDDSKRQILTRINLRGDNEDTRVLCGTKIVAEGKRCQGSQC